MGQATTDEPEHHPDCGTWDWHNCTCGASDLIVCDGCGNATLRNESVTTKDYNLSGIVLCKDCKATTQLLKALFELTHKRSIHNTILCCRHSHTIKVKVKEL